MSWLVRLERLFRPLIQRGHRLRRSMTLGVRGVVVDAEGRVLLIEHTYVAGWHLPGGGVERGETAAETLAHELADEAGVRITAPPRLLSVHNNDRAFPGDHILVYRVDRWETCPPAAQGEIRRRGWFSPDQLPDGVTRGTRNRIDEAFGAATPDGRW